MDPLLIFDRVEVCYQEEKMIEDISFSLQSGEILGVLGESGSGKTTLLRSVTGILGKGGRITGGRILFEGRDLTSLTSAQMQTVLGEKIGMIFQDAQASFCPVRRIGSQIYEILAAHRKLSRKEALKRASKLFEKLGLEDPERILSSYPFELSGGMNQRVGAAAAMLLEPSLLLADEPASALDGIAAGQVLEEMKLLRDLHGTGIILVSHQIGVIEKTADQVLVLHHGRFCEYGKTSQVLGSPQSGYTAGLLAAAPRLSAAGRRREDETDSGGQESDRSVQQKRKRTGSCF